MILIPPSYSIALFYVRVREQLCGFLLDLDVTVHFLRVDNDLNSSNWNFKYRQWYSNVR